jgi:hypothetical protein
MNLFGLFPLEKLQAKLPKDLLKKLDVLMVELKLFHEKQ